MSRRRLSSSAKARARLGSASKTRAALIFRTAHTAINCVSACTPAPNTPTVRAFFRARNLVATPLTAPVRTAVR
jgi:hypothetical protein